MGKTTRQRPRRERRQIDFLQLTIGAGVIPPEVQQGQPATIPEQTTFNYYIPPVDSYEERERGAAVESDLSDPVPKNKGVGKNRVRASKQAATKIKSYTGAVTRRRGKQLQEEEELMAKGMGKLVSTGKKMIHRDLASDDQVDDQNSDNDEHDVKPITEFSSHDLIRQNIARPEAFDEEPQPGSNDLITVSIDQSANQSAPAESSSMWSISLNPFSYYRRRSESTVPNESGEGEDAAAGTSGTAAGRIGSVTDAACANPQFASTPN